MKGGDKLWTERQLLLSWLFPGGVERVGEKECEDVGELNLQVEGTDLLEFEW